MADTLISQGRVGKVYRFERPVGSYVKKLFIPGFSARLWNGFFYKSPHPLATPEGIKFAYWKRRLAHRLARFSDERVAICDGVDLLENGFTAPFIEGHLPSRQEKRVLYHTTEKLEKFFDTIGMPTWSFGQTNPFSHTNFILRDSQITIVDYEQSVPIPDARGHMGYDKIYFDDLARFLKDYKHKLLDKLGAEEMARLEEATELAKLHGGRLDIRPRALTRFEEKFSKPLSRKEIEKTVTRLYQEGKLSDAEFQDYRSGQTGENIRLAMKNLAVHAVIGLGTPSYVAAPISAVLRPSWTLGNWFYYTFKGEFEKRRIHSFRVMFISALPLPFPLSGISNGAYLLSIMEESPQIGLAMNNNLLLEFSGKSLEEAMKGLGAKKFLRPLVKSYNSFSRSRMIGWLQEKTMGRNTKKAHDVIVGYLMEGADVPSK